MTLLDKIRNDEAYINIKRRVDELKIPINVNQKIIGFGKYENFYLFYIYENKSGKIIFVARKKYSKKSEVVELMLDKYNLDSINGAIDLIYNEYVKSKNLVKDYSNQSIEKESKNNIICEVKNPNAQLKADEEYRKISIFLKEELSRVRTYFAQLEVLAPYYIFDNKVLEELVTNIPTSKKLLMNISGVGKAKAEKYGERILSTIKMVVNQYQIDEYQWRRYKRVKEPIGPSIKSTPSPLPKKHDTIESQPVLYFFRLLENGIDPCTNKKIEGLSNATISLLQKFLGIEQEEANKVSIEESKKNTKMNLYKKQEKKYRDISKIIKVNDIVTVEDNGVEYSFTIFPVYYEYKPVNDPTRLGRITYDVIPHCDANPELNQIPQTAPLAEAVIGKVPGEEYEFNVKEIIHRGYIKKVVKNKI